MFVLANKFNKIKVDKLNKKFEGGAAGHMNHIYDYNDLTLREIKEIIHNLFYGRIEDITEKLDGMNIQCTMNDNGQVVFIRNKGDLNSEKGGMSIEDVEARWAGKEHVSNVYMSAADIITKVFKKIGKKFFNPNKNTKILANCECIVAGKTNVLLYPSAQVDFHNLWVYTKLDDGKWGNPKVTEDGIDVLDKACKDIDGAQLTPRVVVKVTERSEELLSNYTRRVDAVFKKAGCDDSSTIEDYKMLSFVDLCNEVYPWISENSYGQQVLFNRWFNDDKSISLREIKKMYKDHLDELNNINYKEVVYECMKPLDTFFSSLGNSIILLCDGMVNAGLESEVIDDLSNDLKSLIKEIRQNGSAEMNEKLTTQLNRLAELGNQINASEGIVFRYGDKLIKVTGSFSAVNQILGLRYSI